MKKLFKQYLWIFLLMFSFLAYADTTDIDAFKLNQTKKFFTKDHPKAKGINLSIEYPQNWKAEEGDRPNIVQKFSTVLEDGTTIGCLVLIGEFPSVFNILTDEGIAQEMFSEETIKSMFPGSKLLQHTQTKYDGQPGALSSFLIVQERSGMKILSYLLQHAFIYSKKMIIVHCTIGGLSSNSERIEELYKNHIPLFIQIGNSIVIHDKWNKDITSEESSAMEIAFGEYWWLSLIISVLLTWGLGLLPPILIRFVFIRRPLSKKVSIILVSILWLLNLAFFIAIDSQSKTHVALFLVAIASYYILRKGHKTIENKK